MGEAQERRAFDDRFGDAMQYLEWMRPRIRELHRILKPTGSFYYHCDWHASHYVKVELDRIFGFNNFRNEIVWHYRRWTGRSKHFQRLHDTIFFYSKTNDYTFNPLLTDYTKGSVARKQQGVLHRFKAGEEPYLVSDGTLAKGVPENDVWHIPFVAPSAKERLGYPTQKPLALLERIINVSSNDGDLVLDAFCGCGTTLEASSKLRRNWIGIDFSPTACRVMSQRLEDRLGLTEGTDFAVLDMPKSAEQLRAMPHFEFENWAVVALGGIPNQVKVGDYGIDGRLYAADLPKASQTVGKEGDQHLFESLDRWYPIQVKQMDSVGRPDIDKFETAMRRDKRSRGYFIAFSFTSGAIREIKRAADDGLDIMPITVEEILRHELSVA